MIIQNIVQALTEKKFFLVFSVVSILVFVILSFLTLATTTDYSIEIFVMMNGFMYAVLTFFLFAIIALLMGIYTSLLAYKFSFNKSNLKVTGPGVLGFFTGIIGTGCPMCGALVLGYIGAPLALFFLPFKGLELRILSIVLLAASVFLIARNLTTCKR